MNCGFEACLENFAEPLDCPLFQMLVILVGTHTHFSRGEYGKCTWILVSACSFSQKGAVWHRVRFWSMFVCFCYHYLIFSWNFLCHTTGLQIIMFSAKSLCTRTKADKICVTVWTLQPTVSHRIWHSQCMSFVKGKKKKKPSLWWQLTFSISFSCFKSGDSLLS